MNARLRKGRPCCCLASLQPRRTVLKPQESFPERVSSLSSSSCGMKGEHLTQWFQFKAQTDVRRAQAYHSTPGLSQLSGTPSTPFGGKPYLTNLGDMYDVLMTDLFSYGQQNLFHSEAWSAHNSDHMPDKLERSHPSCAHTAIWSYPDTQGFFAQCLHYFG